jgi:hypothetical protein
VFRASETDKTSRSKQKDYISPVTVTMLTSPPFHANQDTDANQDTKPQERKKRRYISTKQNLKRALEDKQIGEHGELQFVKVASDGNCFLRSLWKIIQIMLNIPKASKVIVPCSNININLIYHFNIYRGKQILCHQLV